MSPSRSFVLWYIFASISITAIFSLDQICQNTNGRQCASGSIFLCDDGDAACSLLCDGENACDGIELHCDVLNLAQCSVTCLTSNSCTNTRIYSSTNTTLDCMQYESCSPNNTVLFLESTSETTGTQAMSLNMENEQQIVVRVSVHYTDFRDAHFPLIEFGDGDTADLDEYGLSLHCIGSETQCETRPTFNPMCTFVDDDYQCLMTAVSGDEDEDDESQHDSLLLMQTLHFQAPDRVAVHSVTLPFQVMDFSWNAVWIESMQFFFIALGRRIRSLRWLQCYAIHIGDQNYMRNQKMLEMMNTTI